MVTQLVAFPAVADFDVHVQHRDDAVQNFFAAVVQKSKFRICHNPQIVGGDQFFEDDFVIVLDGANTWSL